MHRNALGAVGPCEVITLDLFLYLFNEPVEKPVQNTAFPLRLFCLLFVINFAGFWWEFQDKIYSDVNLLL